MVRRFSAESTRIPRFRGRIEKKKLRLLDFGLVSVCQISAKSHKALERRSTVKKNIVTLGPRNRRFRLIG